MESSQVDESQLTPPAEEWWFSPVFWLSASLGPACWAVWWLLKDPGVPVLQFDARFLWVVLVYPVLEECVFRGLLQGQLRRFDSLRTTRAGLSTANLLASIAFTAAHIVVRGFQSWLVLFPSLIFGLLYDRFGRLTPAIAVHAFYNAGFLLLFNNPGGQ